MRAAAPIRTPTPNGLRSVGDRGQHPARRATGPGDAVTAIVATHADGRRCTSGLEWTTRARGPAFPDFDETGCDGLTCNGPPRVLPAVPGCCDTYVSGHLPDGRRCCPIPSRCRSSERWACSSERRARLPRPRLPGPPRLGGSLRRVRQARPDHRARSDRSRADRGRRGVDRDRRRCPRADQGSPGRRGRDHRRGRAGRGRGAGRPGADRAGDVAHRAPRRARFCGVLLSSPQFVLSGLAARGRRRRSLPGDGFDDACARIRDASVPGWTVTCAPGALTATAAP